MSLQTDLYRNITKGKNGTKKLKLKFPIQCNYLEAVSQWSAILNKSDEIWYALKLEKYNKTNSDLYITEGKQSE